jgi:ABC-type transport system substrate-binding protein
MAGGTDHGGEYDVNSRRAHLAAYVLFSAFGRVNWTFQEHRYGYANVSNVAIELTPQTRDQLLSAAEVLAGALNEIGIAAKIEPHPISSVSNTADAIHFLVGAIVKYIIPIYFVSGFKATSARSSHVASTGGGESPTPANVISALDAQL